MALEALRDVFIQAGQNYANRARQDELLAQERARQDELYTRQRGDTEKDMNRRRDEQIASEGRAEAARISAENRALINQVRSGGAEAQRQLRIKYAQVTGNSSVLKVNEKGEFDVSPTAFDDMYLKGMDDAKYVSDLKDATRALEVKKKTFEMWQQGDDREKARGRAAVVDRIASINRELAEVEGLLLGSHAALAARITEGRNKLVKGAVERVAGPAGSVARAKYLAENKKNLSGDESDFSILYNGGQLAMVQAELDAYVKMEGSKDPGANALLQKQVALLRQSTDAHDFARKIEANLTPGSGGQWLAGVSDFGAAPGDTSYFALQKAEANAENPPATTPPPPGAPEGGVPGIDAVKNRLNIVPAAAFSPDPAYRSSSNDVSNDTDPVIDPVVASPGNSTPPAPPPASPAASSGVPAWWSRERDPAANRRAVIEFAKNAPGKVLDPIYDAARTLASKVNPNNFVRGSQVPVYDPVTGKEGVDAVYAYDPEAAANARRMNDERTTTLTEFFTSGDLTRKIGTKLPDITSAGGPTSPNTFFANQDPLLFNQSFSPKPMTFGESFAKRYAEVQNSNMTPREKAKSLAAIVQTRDLLVSRGLTYDSPDPTRSSIKRAGSLSGTVYSGPLSEAPGWAQGAVTVPPQTFPGFFGPAAR